MECKKEIFAKYNKKTIRIYQAYNDEIAHEAVKLQNFGKNFSTERMTWIKPSFLWLMNRSNWGTKKNQENILAIDVYRDFFDSLLEKAVLTSPDSKLYDGKQWEKNFGETDVYCQWDTDRGINGNPLGRYAVQIGIKGNALRDFLERGIFSIEDITPLVRKWNVQRKKNTLNTKDLPTETIYPVESSITRKKLSMQIY